MEPHFVRKSCDRRRKLAILPQSLTIEPHFVRKGCISWRLVGTTPRLKREIEKKEREEDKRARGQESKRRCQNISHVKVRWEDVKVKRCEDVRWDEKMWRCEDEMRRCEDVKMWRWDDEKMRWEDVKMWRWDEKMWRYENVKHTSTIRRTLRSDALGKLSGFWRNNI